MPGHRQTECVVLPMTPGKHDTTDHCRPIYTNHNTKSMCSLSRHSQHIRCTVHTHC